MVYLRAGGCRCYYDRPRDANSSPPSPGGDALPQPANLEPVAGPQRSARQEVGLDQDGPAAGAVVAQDDRVGAPAPALGQAEAAAAAEHRPHAAAVDGEVGIAAADRDPEAHEAARRHDHAVDVGGVLEAVHRGQERLEAVGALEDRR